MKLFKRAVGIGLIGSVFAAMFAGTVADMGLMNAAVTWAIAILGAGAIFLGVVLAVD